MAFYYNKPAFEWTPESVFLSFYMNTKWFKQLSLRTVDYFLYTHGYKDLRCNIRIYSQNPVKQKFVNEDGNDVTYTLHEGGYHILVDNIHFIYLNNLNDSGDIHLSFQSSLKTLVHELTHVVQRAEGRLSTHPLDIDNLQQFASNGFIEYHLKLTEVEARAEANRYIHYLFPISIRYWTGIFFRWLFVF